MGTDLTYGVDPFGVSEDVALKAAATVRRFVPDPAERVAVMLALGLLPPPRRGPGEPGGGGG